MLINKAHCKAYLLEKSKQTRGGKFTRVGGDIYPHLESVLAKELDSIVKYHPSLGKTLMMGTKKHEPQEGL